MRLLTEVRKEAPVFPRFPGSFARWFFSCHPVPQLATPETVGRLSTKLLALSKNIPFSQFHVLNKSTSKQLTACFTGLSTVDEDGRVITPLVVQSADELRPPIRTS